MRPRWHDVNRAGTALACADYGGEGPPVMLLHGLCGHAEEWRATASWLLRSHRVLAPDARGHGRSDRFPTDVSRAAQVADAEAWLEHFNVGPAVVVGQSLGGHTAFLLAARRPDLVQGLVVVEATPEPGPDAPESVRRWLGSWPVPFPSREAALAFFGGDTLWARAWVEGLDDNEDGLRPRFDIDVVLASLAETAETSYWDEWRSLRCPTLIVRGETGALARGTALRMAEVHPNATLAEITGAGHDLHLEQRVRSRPVDADAVELRVLGCMIEKQRTTPDVYPLTLNALRLACNQSTNRDPVVDYDEETIRAGLHRLVQRGWARLASGAGSRAVKYRHLLDDALEVTEPELAVLCVLMLRGPQTPGELKARTERMHRFESLGELHETLDRLVQRELVARLRRPGQKEERYRQLLGHDEAGAGETEAAVSPEQSADLEARISRLEEDVATLRQALESLAPMGSEYQPPGAGV